jgi:zinc protease
MTAAVRLVACGGSAGTTDSTATTIAPPPATSGPTTTRPPAVLPEFADDADTIALDAATTAGVLDNGMAFYIRENTAPGGRAQLRLVVKAGSAHESDAQLGVAHFLEHMMFNGTESFPANELVQVLQRSASSAGHQRFTSYEETVYMLEFPPTIRYRGHRIRCTPRVGHRGDRSRRSIWAQGAVEECA